MCKRHVANHRKHGVRVIQLSKVYRLYIITLLRVRAADRSSRHFFTSFQLEQFKEGDPRPEAVRHHIMHRGYGLAVLQCKNT